MIAQVAAAYRAHWRTLLVVGLLVFVPLGLIELLDHRLQEPLADDELDQLDPGLLAAIFAGVIGHATAALLGEVVYAGIVAAAVTAGTARPPLRELLRHLPFWRLVCVDLLWVVVVVVGFLALVVPGLIFITWFALVAPAVEIEGRGVTDAFRRSRELVRTALLVRVGADPAGPGARRPPLQRRGRGFVLGPRRRLGRGVGRLGARQPARLPPLRPGRRVPVPRTAPRCSRRAYSRCCCFARYSSSVEPPIAVRTSSLNRSVRRPGWNLRSAFACLSGVALAVEAPRPGRAGLADPAGPVERQRREEEPEQPVQHPVLGEADRRGRRSGATATRDAEHDPRRPTPVVELERADPEQRSAPAPPRRSRSRRSSCRPSFAQ